MKAIVRDQYGGPEVLRLEEIATPVPDPNEVLIQINAASVAKGDWEILRGDPFWVRLVGFGFRHPKQRTLGYNFAGRIEAVGEQVSRYKPGDLVFGDCLHARLGAFAERIALPEDAAFVHMPENLGFDQAASLPEAGCIVLQAFHRTTQLESGQRVLINGAGGGAGSLAIQYAKSQGAIVTAIDRGEKLDFMRSLGADEVIDYTEASQDSIDQTYDVIFDVVGTGSIGTWNRMLRPHGQYLAAGGSVSQIIKTLAQGAWFSATTSKRLGMLTVSPTKEDLELLCNWIASETITPTIDQTFSLDDVPDAIRYLGDGRSKGKVVIAVA